MQNNFSKNSLTNLYDTINKTDDTVFIIGGGPSVLSILTDDVDISNKDIIVVNNAYKLFPNALICHFMDNMWWQWHQDSEHNIKDNFHGDITVATTSHRDYVREDRIITYIHDNKKGGLSLDKQKLNGSNAGHQAINVAYHLGYKKVVLIGFDSNHKDTQTHWHNDHKRSSDLSRYNDVFMPAFHKISEDITKHKLTFQIYNANITSAIKCFEYKNIQDFI